MQLFPDFQLEPNVLNYRWKVRESRVAVKKIHTSRSQLKDGRPLFILWAVGATR